MKEINIELFNDGNINCDNLIIGKTLENEATRLNIKLTDELSDKDFFLEFQKPEGKKLTTYKIDVIDNQVIYNIPNSLLNEQGNLLLEIVLRKDEQVWKSYNLDFTILESINASEEVPEKFPDFVTEANKILSHIELDGDGKSFLANDGTYKKGGTGGTSNYEDLENKPSINDVILTGNKTLDELNIQSKGDYALKSEIPTKTSQLLNDSDLVSDKDYVHTDNNFTALEKEKLSSLNNYDDTEIKQEINKNKADIKDISDNMINYSLITETGSKIDLNIDTTTYIMTLKLLDKNNNELSSGQVDLPIESMIINVTYENKILTFTLQNGQTIDVLLNDLISGLITQEVFDEALAKKVDKVIGKDLSTNDFTNEDKEQIQTNKTDIASINLNKLDKEEIKTINGESLIGTGNIEITASVDLPNYHIITPGSSSRASVNIEDLEPGIYYLDNDAIQIYYNNRSDYQIFYCYMKTFVIFKKFNEVEDNNYFGYIIGSTSYSSSIRILDLRKSNNNLVYTNSQFISPIAYTVNTSNLFQNENVFSQFPKVYVDLVPTQDNELVNKGYVDNNVGYKIIKAKSTLYSLLTAKPSDNNPIGQYFKNIFDYLDIAEDEMLSIINNINSEKPFKLILEIESNGKYFAPFELIPISTDGKNYTFVLDIVQDYFTGNIASSTEKIRTSARIDFTIVDGTFTNKSFTYFNYDVANLTLSQYTGYDNSKTQVLKNINGTFTWVDEA